MSQSQPGMLVVSRGSGDNLDFSAASTSSGRAQIRAFDVTNITEPLDYSTSGVRLGYGLRNSVGVAEDPSTGGIYSVENSADEVERNGVDIHVNNPGEELNFHGYLNDTTERGNYGYPNCFALWNTSIPDLGDLKVGDQFALNQSTNLNDQYCETQTTAPRLTFQAHTAPLDILFQPNGSEAYVSFHGSWNRDSPIGYSITSLPFAGGNPTLPSDSTNTSNIIIQNPDNKVCPDSCFRPVGLALDGKGRLWFSSDSTGEVWVMERTGVSTGTVGGSGTGGSATSAGAPAASETKAGAGRLLQLNE
ncbi:putative L-sorbosone dehydrogenase [Glarea lozoyensis 74030]|uniref:Putative L-sorbosone dehydrogenase n=1 Tax=Glarea lozoyensis (strain ATCC 74030 / MF5533) TaxID=1104152 RepID=H0EEA9_GLAL7|nr:putative L-sorbosone dehydrogenase [Glarea lozoyensis 74030]